jgi:hypothetical protein
MGQPSENTSIERNQYKLMMAFQIIIFVERNKIYVKKYTVTYKRVLS